jgi:hypothetical protein
VTRTAPAELARLWDGVQRSRAALEVAAREEREAVIRRARAQESYGEAMTRVEQAIANAPEGDVA